MVTLLVVLIGLGLSPAPQIAGAAAQVDPSIIRVYVHTADMGDRDEVSARRESLTHLAHAIGGQKKGKVLAVVDAESAADVVVEVIERRVTVPRVVFGLGPSRAGGRSQPAMAPPTRHVTLVVTIELVSGSDPVEVRNKNRVVESEAGWKSAADDVAKQIEKWTSDRRAAILKVRVR
jgi:hypothetical protein